MCQVICMSKVIETLMDDELIMVRLGRKKETEIEWK